MQKCRRWGTGAHAPPGAVDKRSPQYYGLSVAEGGHCRGGRCMCTASFMPSTRWIILWIIALVCVSVLSACGCACLLRSNDSGLQARLSPVYQIAIGAKRRACQALCGGRCPIAWALLCATAVMLVVVEQKSESSRPSLFPGSRLLTPEWGGTLNGWAGKGEGQEWSLCCSTFEGCDTAAKFHAGCDAHTPTLTVAHNAGNGGSNPGNFTFGGFVRTLSTHAASRLSLIC